MPIFSTLTSENIQQILADADIKGALGDQLAAITLYEQACSHLQQSKSDYDILTKTLDKLGDSHRDMGNKIKAQECYRRVIDKVDTLDANQLIMKFITQGKSFHILGHYELALDQYKAALQKLEKEYGKGSTHTVSTLNKIGDLYRDDMKFQNARDYYLESLNILKKSTPLNKAAMATTLRKLGSVSQHLKEFKAAKALYQQAFDIKNTNLYLSMGTVNLLNSLGSLAYEMKEDSTAKAHLTNSIALIAAHYKETPNRYMANACTWLSKVEERLGNIDEAVRLRDKATSVKVKLNSQTNYTTTSNPCTFWKYPRVTVTVALAVSAAAAAALVYRP